MPDRAANTSAADVLRAAGLLGHERLVPQGPGTIPVRSPADGSIIAHVRADDAPSTRDAIARSREAFLRWRTEPAPRRGLLVRDLAQAFRERQDALADLITLEVGKIPAEARGEVQEVIDVADFALGLSRQLYGLTMPSERPGHRIIEQWLPLGPIGVITAFNFPIAVWAWNAMLAAVCGDSVLWKPSALAPLTALASHEIARSVAQSAGHPDLFTLAMGPDAEVGEVVVGDARLPLISATGSCAMGRRVGQVVASRLGRCLLELGGNNAAILHRDANLKVAIPAVVFAAVGTAGQRCTTTRRLIVHEDIADDVVAQLTRAYATIRVGHPAASGTLVGPLISAGAVAAFERAIAQAREQGGTVVAGGRVLPGPGNFVEPTIILAPRSGGGRGWEPGAGGPRVTIPIALEETFAPILTIFTYREIEEALALNNGVAQGLSSAIFTDSFAAAEAFLGPAGSDCGIANVNGGTSGAEIGGAFGGEKDTGGGRESGSDAWKAYMRRQTATLNASGTLTLAQGIRFE